MFRHLIRIMLYFHAFKTIDGRKLGPKTLEKIRTKEVQRVKELVLQIIFKMKCEILKRAHIGCALDVYKLLALFQKKTHKLFNGSYGNIPKASVCIMC